MTIKPISCIFTLPENILDNLNFIKDKYKSDVFYQKSEAILDYRLTASTINDLPFITCSAEFEPTLSDIVHELWHFYLKAYTGINNYNFGHNLKTEILNKINYNNSINDAQQNFPLIFVQLYSEVHHFYFFPKMDKKLKPFEDMEKDVNETDWTLKTCYFYDSVLSILSILRLLILEHYHFNVKTHLDTAQIYTQNELEKARELMEILKGYENASCEPLVIKKLITKLFLLNANLKAIKMDSSYIFINDTDILSN